MTRVILTNKQTGQELPEAELVYDESSTTWDIQFDGAARPNTFSRNEWNYREVRTFRNGDVLRRKDQSENFAFYVYTKDDWVCVGGSAYRTPGSEIPDPLARNDPEWELV